MSQAISSSVLKTGKEDIKCLCYVYIIICEVTNLSQRQTNVISDPPFTVNIFKNAIFAVLHSADQLEF